MCRNGRNQAKCEMPFVKVRISSRGFDVMTGKNVWFGRRKSHTSKGALAESTLAMKQVNIIYHIIIDAL